MSSSFILANGLRIHYLRWPAGETSRPIVLLHGLASNARIWELVAPHLTKTGFACFSPDGRGHGLSDKPEDGYDTETFTRDLAAFLEVCDIERPLLVGHSWGASVVLDYAARLSAGPRAPRGIVMVDGGFTQLDDQPGATWEAVREQLTPPRLAGMPVDDFVSRLKGWTASWRPDEAIFPLILANFQIDENERISPHLSFDHHMQIVRSIWEFRTYEHFKRVRCPALMIPVRPKGPLSEPDRRFLVAKERGIQKAKETLRDLHVAWMPDSIHDLPLQQPEKLARMIADFAATLPT